MRLAYRPSADCPAAINVPNMAISKNISFLISLWFWIYAEYKGRERAGLYILQMVNYVANIVFGSVINLQKSKLIKY